MRSWLISLFSGLSVERKSSILLPEDMIPDACIRPVTLMRDGRTGAVTCYVLGIGNHMVEYMANGFYLRSYGRKVLR